VWSNAIGTPPISSPPVSAALNVYHVSQWQLTVLLLAKLLGKSTLETFLHK